MFKYYRIYQRRMLPPRPKTHHPATLMPPHSAAATTMTDALTTSYAAHPGRNDIL